MVDMAGFRNVIVHEYARIDADTVVRILREHLEDFRRFEAEAPAGCSGPGCALTDNHRGDTRWAWWQNRRAGRQPWTLWTRSGLAMTPTRSSEESPCRRSAR